jgi:oxalate decarboxylase
MGAVLRRSDAGARLPDPVFIEVFPTPFYEDISLAEWMPQSPHWPVDQHFGIGEEMLRTSPKVRQL